MRQHIKKKDRKKKKKKKKKKKVIPSSCTPIVDELDRLVDRINRNDWQERAEYLVLHQLRVQIDVGQQRRRDEAILDIDNSTVHNLQIR
jgi:hypothetical protein